MTALLTATHYPAIRAALEVTLTSKELPDAVIALDIYLAAAIAEVLARDPLAESRTGAALTHVTNAGVLICAAQLRKRADLELAAVLTPTEATPSRPTMFARAPGRRG